MLFTLLLRPLRLLAPDETGGGFGSVAAIGEAYDQATGEETASEQTETQTQTTETKPKEGSAHQTGEGDDTQSKTDEGEEYRKALKALGGDHPLLQQLSKTAHTRNTVTQERDSLADENSKLKAKIEELERVSAQTASQTQQKPSTPGQYEGLDLSKLKHYTDEYGNKVVEMPNGDVVLEEYAAQQVEIASTKAELADTKARLDRFEQAQFETAKKREYDKIASDMLADADKALAEAYPYDLGDLKDLTRQQTMQLAAKMATENGQFNPALMKQKLSEAAKLLAFADGERANLQIKHNAEAATRQPISKGEKPRS